MLPEGSFADVKCTETFPYLCYKKVTPGMAMTACGTTDTCKLTHYIALVKLLLFYLIVDLLKKQRMERCYTYI